MEQYKAWLYKANNDLRSAKILVAASDPVLDVAIYHTQQCAEKSLKSFLAYKKRELKKLMI